MQSSGSRGGVRPCHTPLRMMHQIPRPASSSCRFAFASSPSRHRRADADAITQASSPLIARARSWRGARGRRSRARPSCSSAPTPRRTHRRSARAPRPPRGGRTKRAAAASTRPWRFAPPRRWARVPARGERVRSRGVCVCACAPHASRHPAVVSNSRPSSRHAPLKWTRASHAQLSRVARPSSRTRAPSAPRTRYRGGRRTAVGGARRVRGCHQVRARQQRRRRPRGADAGALRGRRVGGARRVLQRRAEAARTAAQGRRGGVRRRRRRPQRGGAALLEGADRRGRGREHQVRANLVRFLLPPPPPGTASRRHAPAPIGSLVRPRGARTPYLAPPRPGPRDD